MKKRLLLAALAVVSALSSFAFNVNDYIFTATGRVKVMGENLVTNGNFADNATGWTNPAGDPLSIAGDPWSVEPGVGPAGESALKSNGATKEAAICGRWQPEEPGLYVVSVQFKGTALGNTDIISVTEKDGTVTTTIPANCVDFFLNTDGARVKVLSAEDAPVVNVASSMTISDEWKTLAFTANVEQGQWLVMRIEQLASESMITNIEIHKAMSVYDIRIAENKIAQAKVLLEHPEFNTADAAEAHDTFAGIMGMVEQQMATDQFDDASYVESLMEAFDGALEEFLVVTSTNMNSKLVGLDFPSLPNVGRGRNFTAGTVTNLEFTGGNWGHVSNADYMMTAIQSGQTQGPAFFTTFNKDFPAGRYFISGAIRNANVGKSSWPCPGQVFNLETMCKMYIGADTVEIGPIVGEDYQWFYMSADIKNDGDFRAGFWWPGTEGKVGGAFYVKDVKVRYFGDPDAAIERKQAWDKFIAQWNAAVNARTKLQGMVGDKNYPWQQDSLKNALTKWDPYYNEIIAKGWVTADGTDAGVATNDELTDWTLYQGVEAYSEPDENGDTKRLEYQVVRGYQNAINFVVAENKNVASLKDALVDANKFLNSDRNAEGDKATYKKAIDDAQAVLDDVMNNSTDAKKEADDARLVAQIEALATAKTAFEASANLTPIVDIDFSNSFETVTDPETGAETYVIKGAAGQMEFTSVEMDNVGNKDALVFMLGYNGEYNDVLRIGCKGSGSAIVNLPEAATEEDVIEVSYDSWYGNMGSGYLQIQLLNEAGERVAGHSFDRYNGATEYNDFNNAENTGLDLKTYVSGVGSSSAGNIDIVAESNKSSFTLVVDLKSGYAQGKLVNAKNGTCDGEAVPLNETASGDKKITQFTVTSNYGTNAPARRCWFDNLKIYKYKSSGNTGISDVVAADKVAANAVYTISGMKVATGKQNLKKGLYIQNGKKFVVK